MTDLARTSRQPHSSHSRHPLPHGRSQRHLEGGSTIHPSKFHPKADAHANHGPRTQTAGSVEILDFFDSLSTVLVLTVIMYNAQRDGGCCWQGFVIRTLSSSARQQLHAASQGRRVRARSEGAIVRERPAEQQRRAQRGWRRKSGGTRKGSSGRSAQGWVGINVRGPACRQEPRRRGGGGRGAIYGPTRQKSWRRP